MTAGFGAALKQLRQELGLSQSDLANAIESTQRHMSFLETGRSQPTRTMIGRLATELRLNAGQRAALFQASGLQNPYKNRSYSSDEITDALDMIEHRVLDNWPFPAFVLDQEWNALRMNGPAAKLFAPYVDTVNGVLNMFELFLSPNFRALVENWNEASTAIYFRLQTASAHSEKLRQKFDEARHGGVFDGIASRLTDAKDIPIYVPIEFRLPNGALLRATSLLGQLVSVHDALVEGFEIELLVPVDKASEDLLRLISIQ